jgi:hypothetical protein
VIDAALKFLVGEINAYLFARTGVSTGAVDLGRLVDDTGKIAIKDDSIGAALVNVEEERVLRAQLPDTVFVDGRHVQVQPELKLNLHVIFAANFKNYPIALQQLSWVLTFFQSHPGFTRDRYPALDPRIEKLAAELQSLTFEQLNQMWGFIGGKQLPSVVYRLRLIALQDLEPVAIAPPVTVITGTLHRA